MAALQAAHYQDEDAARKHLEAIRWPQGPECPRCALIGNAYKLAGKSTRRGLYKCAGCRQPFTVTVGTILENSHIPLHKWLLAIHLMCSSRKGINAHQLWRSLWDINPDTGKQRGSYRTAWFMAHRVRWALGQKPLAIQPASMVEISETNAGGKKRTGSYGYKWSASGRPKPGPRKGASAADNRAAALQARAGSRMPKPGASIRIPLSEREALAGLMKVKLADQLPRPWANPAKAKKSARKPGKR